MLPDDPPVETPLPAPRLLYPDVPGFRPDSFTLDADESAIPGASVLLDFGREWFGFLRFRGGPASPARTARVRVRLGESATEAIEGGWGDELFFVEPGQSIVTTKTGFRYVLVVLEQTDGSVELHDLEGVAVVRPEAYVGAFRCSDDRLTRVWEVGAHTARLCMQGTLWDGVKRGRRPWAGDLHPAARVVSAVYGNHPVVPATLRALRDDSARAPGRPYWVNGIPGYTLWWVIAAEEWARAHGPGDWLAGYRDYLRDVIDLIAESVGPDGGEAFDGWRYLDWATRDEAAVHAGYQGLLAWALRSAITLAMTCGDGDLCLSCERLLGRVTAYRPPPTRNKAATALLALGGLIDPTAAAALLAADPTAGLTPFTGYHVLEARALAGDYGGCLDLIRTYWGAMLDLGATTFWEDFDLGWAKGAVGLDGLGSGPDIHRDFGRCTYPGFGQSLCHAWAAGPTAWLSEHVLGVRPVGGWERVRVRPTLGDLAWAEGAYPTPFGPVQVRHEKTGGGIDTKVEPPPGVQIVG